MRFLEDIKEAFSHIKPKPLIMGLVLIGFIIYLLSGIYVVNPGEVAVLRRLGRYTGESIGEGIHYRFPWPIDKVDKVNVEEIKKHSIGVPFEAHPLTLCPPDVHETFTGDENIVDVKLMVHYRIKDPAGFLFNLRYEEPHRSTHRLVKDTVRAMITSLVGKMSMDEVITTAKTSLALLIREEAQKLLDKYNSGIQIVTVNFEGSTPAPPDEVIDAFVDVQNAKEEKEREIHRAEAYANTVIPEAQGQAYRLLNDAEAYKAKVINQAKGDAARFLAMLEEYKKGGGAFKNVTDYRFYVETMEKVFSRMKKYIVDSGDDPVNLRFLDKH